MQNGFLSVPDQRPEFRFITWRSLMQDCAPALRTALVQTLEFKQFQAKVFLLGHCTGDPIKKSISRRIKHLVSALFTLLLARRFAATKDETGRTESRP